MALSNAITVNGILIRFVFACILVFTTNNPFNYSLYHLVKSYPN